MTRAQRPRPNRVAILVVLSSRNRSPLDPDWHRHVSHDQAWMAGMSPCGAIGKPSRCPAGSRDRGSTRCREALCLAFAKPNLRMAALGSPAVLSFVAREERSAGHEGRKPPASRTRTVKKTSSLDPVPVIFLIPSCGGWTEGLVLAPVVLGKWGWSKPRCQNSSDQEGLAFECDEYVDDYRRNSWESRVQTSAVTRYGTCLRSRKRTQPSAEELVW